ncbi:MAG: sialate O-acetylesterase [Spirochaetota bacterium]
MRIRIIFLALVGAAGLFAETKIPSIFSSNMVIQQDKPIVIWGWDDAGTTVTVSFAGKSAQAIADGNGRWQAVIPAMKADGKTYTMTVKGTSSLTFDNVVIGEVWLGSGQSNMEWSVRSVTNAELEMAAANFPNIRLFLVPKRVLATPDIDIKAVWQICASNTVPGFSAAAYFFGREIHNKLRVPVGLIASAWGGTRIEPWTEPSAFGEIPTLMSMYTQALCSDPRTPLHKERMEQFLSGLETWIAASRSTTIEEKSVTNMPSFPQELMPPKDQQSPSSLYNGMIYAMIPYAIRGALWYQGEANHGEGMLYVDKKRALIDGWRRQWNSDFSFYFVQIAPYHYGGENPSTLAEFWEAVATIPSTISNTGMAVVYDVGNTNDIHPRNKQEVGRRLANIALAKTYGQKGIVYNGPVYKSHTVEGDTMKLSFDHIGSGLASRDGKPLTWFELVDADEGGYFPANASIAGNTVVVSSPQVKKPVFVRFGWHKVAEPNLMNKEGLPAWAFRAGAMPTNRDPFVFIVPDAGRYKLVYDLDLAKLGATITCDTDNSADAGSFDRIAYYLELRTAAGETQWVHVSMNAFTDDASKIGIPTVASKAKFQDLVTGMNVFSSTRSVASGMNMRGNIEFWPNNYGGQNAKNIPNASTTAFDLGDQMSDPEDGYGCMQVHNYDARQTIFAVNSWKSGQRADIGIGNASGVNTDWTFSGAGSQYTYKRLKIYVRPK